MSKGTWSILFRSPSYRYHHVCFGSLSYTEFNNNDFIHLIRPNPYITWLYFVTSSGFLFVTSFDFDFSRSFLHLISTFLLVFFCLSSFMIIKFNIFLCFSLFFGSFCVCCLLAVFRPEFLYTNMLWRKHVKLNSDQC